MAKKSAKEKNDKRYKVSNKKITLNSKLAIEYARFHSTPYSLRRPGLKNVDDFLTTHGYSANSRNIVYNISQLPGFWELRQQYATQYHSHYEEVADTGLLRRAEGMTIRTEAIAQKTGEVVTLEKEIEPDVSACVAIKKIFGKYEEKIQINGLGDVARQIARGVKE